MEAFFSVPQIIGYIALVIYVAAYLFKNDNTLKVVFSISNVFWIGHYYLINAQTAAVSTALVTLRNLLSLNSHDFSAKKKFWLAWTFTVLLLIAGMLTWAGWISLIPVSTTILATHSILYLKGIRLRKTFLVIDFAWMMHALLVLSVGGFIYAVGAMLINGYTIFRMKREASQISAS